MRAVVYRNYGPPEVLSLEEVPKPVPRDDEVLVRVQAAAVTTADRAARTGSPVYARFAFGLTRPKHSILGTELAGEIEAAGRNVETFKEGDAVFAATGDDFGAHAEYLTLPAGGALALKPSNLNFQEAVAVSEGGLTALPFLREWGGLEKGQRVLVNGAAGAVGTSAVQLARYLGAEVTGVCSGKNADLVSALGAHHVVDYTRDDFTRGRQTYHLVFDAVGMSSFPRCKGILEPGGIYLTTVPSFSILLYMPWTSGFGGKRAGIQFAGLRSPEEKARDLEFLRDLAEAGEIRPVLDSTYTMDQAVEAHRRVDTGHKTGSVVLVLE